MVRRHVDGAQRARARPALASASTSRPSLVDGQRHQARARRRQRAPRRPIAERLDGDDVAGREQRARHQVERHLAAARDHRASSASAATPRSAESIAAERRAQPRVAARVAVVEQRRAVRRERAPIGARQRRHRHEAHVGDAARHRAARWRSAALAQPRARLAPRRARRDGSRPSAAQLEAARRRGRARAAVAAPRSTSGSACDTKVPRAASRRDPALGRQLGVGGQHGVAMDAERARQRAAARQRVARPAAARAARRR